MTDNARLDFALFDVDGLLLDTEIIYTEVTQHIVGRFGKVFDWSVKANMIGRAALESAKYLVEVLQLPITAQDYLDERNGLLRERFAQCNAMPGAETLIRHLHQQNVSMAVATSSSQELFQLKKSCHPDWFDLFDIEITSDHPDVNNAKPAPDIFNVAASGLNADKKHTLVFEDAPSGLTAGIAAGIRVVVVPDANMDRSRYQGATQILDSLADFKPETFGRSPITA